MVTPVTAPASRSHAGPLLLKLGGRALEAPGASAELAHDVRAFSGGGGRAVLVHGGGAEVTGWCAKLGLEPRFHRGLRVSDPATLEVAVAVLAGLANKRLVSTLRADGLDAVGLAALDGGIVTAVPHAQAATLGAVGEVSAIDSSLLSLLLERGSLPVLASIAAHGDQLLNINADDLAAALAPALGAHTLVLLSDAPGLKLDGALVPALDRDGLAAALDHPDVQGGMAPKLRAAAAALDAGTERVILAAWQGAGTLAGLLAGSTPATIFTPTPAREAAHG